MTEPLRLVTVDDSSLAPADALSFEEFFEREKAELYGALCLITRNRHEAEEITQDTFVRILERWDRVGTLEDPRGYLYRAAMNTVRSRYRRALLTADAIAVVDAKDVAVRALASLSPRQRAAVVLTDLLGYTSHEAAVMLGIRASTRPHARLPRACGPEGGDAR